jgi:LysM repeat protein
MTDESLTPAAELASAAFDNEVTSAERAQVQASAAMSAQVVAFSSLRNTLADVRVPTTARETALAAALATFDERAESAKVISLHHRRQRQYRWLTGAAAATVVLVFAVGALNTSSDDKQSSQPLDVSAQDSPNSQGSQTKAATSAEAGAPAEVSNAGAPPPAANGDISAINGPAVATPWAFAPAIDTTQELIAYAADPTFGVQPTAAVQSSTVATTATSGTARNDTGNDTAKQFNTTCLADVTSPFAPVVFQGQQVLVIRDDQSHSLRVIDPRTCRVVATIDLS